MESLSKRSRIGFTDLHDRLLDFVNNRIRNGEFTERGLARALRISQPQVHNILKRARALRPEVADLFLSKLNISALDLLNETELSANLTIRNAACRVCPLRAENSIADHVPTIRLSSAAVAGGNGDS